MQGVLHLRKEEGVQPSTQSYTCLSTMLQGNIPGKQANKQTMDSVKFIGMLVDARDGVKVGIRDIESFSCLHDRPAHVKVCEKRSHCTR
jgi:hypothetical protein